jgi:hypothetical protein
VTYQDTSGTGAAIGAAGGAAAGAVLGGPVGAAIGYAAGGLLGGLTSVPDPVVSYVREHRTETVYLDGEVVVGGTIPEEVELVEVPDTEFRYVYVNEVPAVVEPGSRRIVRIVRCAPSTRSIGGCTTCLFSRELLTHCESPGRHALMRGGQKHGKRRRKVAHCDQYGSRS